MSTTLSFNLLLFFGGIDIFYVEPLGGCLRPADCPWEGRWQPLSTQYSSLFNLRTTQLHFCISISRARLLYLCLAVVPGVYSTAEFPPPVVAGKDGWDGGKDGGKDGWRNWQVGNLIFKNLKTKILQLCTKVGGKHAEAPHELGVPHAGAGGGGRWRRRREGGRWRRWMEGRGWREYFCGKGCC